jgi:hypothetical protein
MIVSKNSFTCLEGFVAWKFVRSYQRIRFLFLVADVAGKESFLVSYLVLRSCLGGFGYDCIEEFVYVILENDSYRMIRFLLLIAHSFLSCYDLPSADSSR